MAVSGMRESKGLVRTEFKHWASPKLPAFFPLSTDRVQRLLPGSSGPLRQGNKNDPTGKLPPNLAPDKNQPFLQQPGLVPLAEQWPHPEGQFYHTPSQPGSAPPLWSLFRTSTKARIIRPGLPVPPQLQALLVGHPFHPGESAPGQNQQDFCPLPAARLALLWFRSLQDSGYCLPGMSGSMAALPRQGIIILTYVLAALELTCLFMQFSILPYLSRTLGLDSVSFGYLQTTFGVLQLLGGPVFGRFADQCGARAALSLSFLAASALYLLLVASCSPALPGVFLLFASRIPSALMHTLPAAQMVITDLTAPTERPAALGRLGLCFGIGIIFGSLLGGTLNTAYGIQCPAILAFVVTLLGAVLSFTCVPATTKEASVQSAPQGGTKASVFDLKAITRLLLLPRVLPVFLVKVISGLPSGLFLVMFSIISMDFFQLEAAQAGYLMSFFGILQMMIQGLVIGRLSTHFPEEALLRSSVLVFAVVGLGMALMSSVLHFCFLMPGLVFSLCTLNVVTDSMLTKAVSASDTGTMLGLSASVQPLTRTLGPTLGGLLYRSYGVPIFGHVQLMVNLLVLLVLWKKPLSQKGEKAR